MNNMITKLVENLHKEELISEEDKIIYLFGLKELISLIINVFTIILIGIIFGELIGVMFFAISFMTLRKYAGGYHAPTPVRCYMMTCTVLAGSAIVLKNIDFSNGGIILGLCISAAVILIMSPVECKNKPLDSLEKKIYRKKALFIWGVGVVIAISCCWWFEVIIVTKSIMLANCILALSQIGESVGKRNVY